MVSAGLDVRSDLEETIAERVGLQDALGSSNRLFPSVHRLLPLIECLGLRSQLVFTLLRARA